MAMTDKLVRGMIIKYHGEPHLVIEREFYKPGKGASFNKTKLKNLLNGKVLSQTFKSNEKVEELDVMTKSMIYIYSDDYNAYFMDPDTFDQIPIPLEIIPGKKNYLLEEQKYIVSFYEDKVISIQPPIKMTLKVTHTTDGVRGNTAGNATKEAELETGIKIQVPLFIKENDKIVINTETGTYYSK